MKKIVVIWTFITFLSICAALAAGNADSRKIHGASDGVCEGNEVYLIDNKGDTFNIIHAKRSGGMVGEISLPKLNGSWWNAYRFLCLDKGEPDTTEDGTGVTAYVYRYGTSMETVEEQSAVFRCNFEDGSLEPVWQLPGVRLHGIRVSGGALYYAAPEDETDMNSGISFYSMDETGKRTLLGAYDFPYGSTVSTYYSTSSKTAMWSDVNGRIYYNGEEVEAERHNQNEYVHIVLGDQGTIRTDLADNETKLIPFRGQPQINLFSLKRVQLEDIGLSYSDVLPFGYESDQVWTAGINLKAGTRVLGIFDRSGRRLQIIPEVEITPDMRLRKGVKAGALCFVLLSVLAGGVLLFLNRTGGTVPIIVKLLVVLIPVIAVCSCQLSARIYTSFRERVIRMEENLLYEIADQMLSGIRPEDMAAVNVDRIPDDPSYRKIFGHQDHFRSDKVMYDPSGERIPVTVRTYRWLYLLKEGTLRYAVVDDNYYGGKVSCYRDREQMGLIRTAMVKKRVITSEYNDQEGSWIVLYVPVFGEGGTVLGIMESGMSQGVIQYEAGQEITLLHRQIFLVMGILCGLLILVLGVCLYPLGRLKTAVNAMTAGELGRTVKARGHDEVSDISAAFNRMSVRITEQMEFIRSCLEGYEKFVPGKVFGILERKDITEAELGDQREITAAVLAAGAEDFASFERNMSGEELYAMINRMMCAMIPAVGNRGGVVDRMTDSGITSFYTEGSGDALRSAITICENWKAAGSEGEVLPDIRVSVTYGRIRVGIVGEGNRAAAATIGEIIPFAEFLKEMAQKYGASILIDRTAAEQIKDFHTAYHSRMIGYVFLTMADKLEPVYEVFDGDIKSDRRLKEETEPLLDAAMKEYSGGQYYEARQKFAAILKVNGRDRVAREYIYRCDKYYRLEDPSQITVYLEKY